MGKGGQGACGSGHALRKGTPRPEAQPLRHPQQRPGTGFLPQLHKIGVAGAFHRLLQTDRAVTLPLMTKVGMVPQPVKALAAVVLRRLHPVFQGGGRHAYLEDRPDIPRSGGTVHQGAILPVQRCGNMVDVIGRHAAHGTDGPGFDLHQHHGAPPQHCRLPFRNGL